MQNRIFKTILVLVAISVCNLIFVHHLLHAADKDWSFNLFYGQLTQSHFEEIFYTASELEERDILGVSVRREFLHLKDKLKFVPQDFYLDWEAVLAHKWGDWKGDDRHYQDIAASINLRYEFDREQWLPIKNFSFGNGLSYLTKDAGYEKKVTLNNKKSRLLNYMMVDLGFRVPFVRDWEWLLRVHHRSGVYGLFNGVQGGSNYITTGLRYRF